ncbi:MAG: PorV/PorQ family protein, partial [bacterium]
TLSPLPSHASGVGTTGAAFLKVGVGARPLAMGNAFVALPDDANAINWNPGALGELKDKSATASYSSLFMDQNQGFIAYAAPLKENMGTLGFGVNYMLISDIEKRAGDTETADSTFNNTNMAVSVSYARSGLYEGLSLGANLKYINEKLDTFSESATAIDLGALYNTKIENLTAGFMVQNIGTKIGPDPLPLTVKGGLAYRLLEKKLVLAMDGDWLAIDKRAYLDLGAEYWMNKNLAVRAGYQVGRGQDKLGSSLVGAGFGMGIKLDKFNMDYAFVPFGDLGNTHRITLGMRF